MGMGDYHFWTKQNRRSSISSSWNPYQGGNAQLLRICRYWDQSSWADGFPNMGTVRQSRSPPWRGGLPIVGTNCPSRYQCMKRRPNRTGIQYWRCTNNCMLCADWGNTQMSWFSTWMSHGLPRRKNNQLAMLFTQRTPLPYRIFLLMESMWHWLHAFPRAVMKYHQLILSLKCSDRAI